MTEPRSLLRRGLGLLVWTLTLACVSGVGAQELPVPAPTPARVVIVSSDSSPVYAEAAQSLIQTLASQGVPPAQVTQVYAREIGWQLQSAQPPRPAAFVALGTAASQTLLQAQVRLTAPVLCALIPRHTFERLMQDARASVSAAAVFLDQPITRQLRLLRLAWPQGSRLAVLWGPDSARQVQLLKSLAGPRGWQVQDARVQQPEDLSDGLGRILEDADVFLALPDPAVFNSGSIQNILLTAVRERVPLVGFSSAYVRAGAVLALFSTPRHAGQQAGREVLKLLQGAGGWAVHALEPEDFEVAVNPHVARSLGLSLDAEALRAALRQREGPP